MIEPVDKLTPITVAEVVGKNAEQYRGRHSAEQLARFARDFGLKWSSGRVSDLEHGRISPTLPTLFALTKALTALTGANISIADLLMTDHRWVSINDSLTVRAEVVVEALTTGRRLSGNDRRIGAKDVADAIRLDVFGEGDSIQISDLVGSMSESELRVARALDMSKTQFAHRSIQLWGRSFSEERDRRSGDDASAQKRGRVSRDLKTELQAVITSGND